MRVEKEFFGVKGKKNIICTNELDNFRIEKMSKKMSDTKKIKRNRAPPPKKKKKSFIDKMKENETVDSYSSTIGILFAIYNFLAYDYFLSIFLLFLYF